MGEHGGTHVDAPFHFNEFGWKLGEIPLNRLVDVRAAVVDLEKEVFALNDPRQFKVEVSHEKKYGQIPTEGVVIIHIGWGERYWPNQEKYWGLENGTLNFPGLSEDAASWLVTERKIVGIGIDTQSIDVGNYDGAPRAHIVLCTNQVYIIENMTNLKNLLKATSPEGISGSYVSASSSGAAAEAGEGQFCNLKITVLPIKSKGTGGPTRVLAYCNHS